MLRFFFICYYVTMQMLIFSDVICYSLMTHNYMIWF